MAATDARLSTAFRSSPWGKPNPGDW